MLLRQQCLRCMDSHLYRPRFKSRTGGGYLACALALDDHFILSKVPIYDLRALTPDSSLFKYAQSAYLKSELSGALLMIHILLFLPVIPTLALLRLIILRPGASFSKLLRKILGRFLILGQSLTISGTTLARHNFALLTN